MEVYFMWGGIAVLLIFLLIGFLTGLIRGVKRSSLHILFFIASMVLAFFITKPITNAILGITITADTGEVTLAQYISQMIQSSLDISSFETVVGFLESIPAAIVGPIAFLIVSILAYFLFDIIYLIVARIAFGKKKKDFKQNKPYRAYGAVVGMVEGFLFLFLLFAPLNSLTQTYQEISQLPPAQAQAYSQDDGKMKTLAETMNEVLPKELNEIIYAYNDSVVGKIAGAGGLDDAFFDYLSNFNLDGEKIEFRKEIVSVTAMYDDFVVVYNNFVDKNFEEMDFTNLKTSLEKVLNNGFFKTVVSNTINDLVVKFDQISQDLDLSSLPEIAQDIIVELKTKFTEENFDTYEYLKHDILKLVDLFETVVEENLISAFENNQDKTFTGYMTVIDQNNEGVKAVAEDLFSLNLVTDSFNSVGKFASSMVADMFENEDGLEIGLNTNIENKDEMVEELLSAVDEFLALNEHINISELLEAEDMVEYLTSIQDLETALTKVGTAFDKLRNLEVLTLPIEEGVRTQEVKVFDNILKSVGFDLLKDEVYLNKTDVTKTKINSYTMFFDFIKPSVITAKNLDVLNADDFDTLLNNILAEVKLNEAMISDLLMPFYQLSAMNLKGLVFDEIIETLETNADILSFSEMKTQNDYHVWEDALSDLGKTLNKLNTGEVGADNKTYLKYILGSGDLSVLEMEQAGQIVDIVKENAYNEGGAVKGVLNEAFAEVIWTLTGDKIIETADYTGKTQSEYASDIKAYLDVENVNEYYTLNYQAKLAELDDVVDFVDTLSENTENITLSIDTIATYVEAIKTSLNSLEGKTEDEKATVLNNTKKLLDNKGETILTPEEKADYGDAIKTAIDDANSGISTQVGTALKALLGI